MGGLSVDFVGGDQGEYQGLKSEGGREADETRATGPSRADRGALTRQIGRKGSSL